MNQVTGERSDWNIRIATLYCRRDFARVVAQRVRGSLDCEPKRSNAVSPTMRTRNFARLPDLCILSELTPSGRVQPRLYRSSDDLVP